MSINPLPAAFLLLLCMPLWAGDDFPPPPDAEVAMIAPSTTSLGMRLRIRRFEVDASVEQVLAFYRDFWKESHAETDMHPWKMIGSRRGNEYHNVQVQAQGAGRSWGYLSVSDLPKRLDKQQYSVQLGKNFPMMGGSLIRDDQLHDDPGKKGRVLLIENKFSPHSNANFYRKHYLNQGWEMLMDETTAPRAKGYAMFFRKGSDTVALTIHEEQGRTMVVANPVSNGLLR